MYTSTQVGSTSEALQVNIRGPTHRGGEGVEGEEELGEERGEGQSRLRLLVRGVSRESREKEREEREERGGRCERGKRGGRCERGKRGERRDNRPKSSSLVLKTAFCGIIKFNSKQPL